jgi:hypothetical protein
MLSSSRIPVALGGYLRRIWCLEALIDFFFGNGEALFEQIFSSVYSHGSSLPVTKVHTVHPFEEYMIVCGYVRCRLRGYYS